MKDKEVYTLAEIRERQAWAVAQLFDLLDENGKALTLDENGQLPAEDLADLIPLKEWAAMHGISPATARQKAGRGALRTARKVGRDWMISRYEPNEDHRFRSALTVSQDKVPMLAPVLRYLLMVEQQALPDLMKGGHSHGDYCRKVFLDLRRQMNANEKVFFDLICKEMADHPDSVVLSIPHEDLIANIRDEMLEETFDFSDYLKVLGNLSRDLMSKVIDLKIRTAGQTMMLSWCRSMTWQHEQMGSLFFVPTDFFRLIVAGLNAS
jgi:hypothetical protein